MKKQMYRIELTDIDSIFTDCVMMASLSNGGQYTPLSKIADQADWLCKKYPASGSMHSVNRIGENVLTIDRGEKNILVITEVEILDWKNEAPSLSRYDAQTILKELEPDTDNQN